MLKKIIIGILIFSSIGFARTNKEIIDAGNEKQKGIFDKYFNSSSAVKNGTAVANSAYADVMTNLYNENRAYFDKEFGRLTGNRRSNFRTMYAYYSDYIVEYRKFLQNAFGAFLADTGEFQSYAYTNNYLLLETFNLNMNTYLEAENGKDKVSNYSGNAEKIEKDVNGAKKVAYKFATGKDGAVYFLQANDSTLRMVNEELEESVTKELNYDLKLVR